MSSEQDDQRLDLTVASVWREERISCPHPHLLQSHAQGGLDGGAAEFLDFHLRESQCPYCNAIVQDLQAQEASAKSPVLEDVKERLLSSTRAALKKSRA
jgi:hypothetical protein